VRICLCKFSHSCRRREFLVGSHFVARSSVSSSLASLDCGTVTLSNQTRHHLRGIGQYVAPRWSCSPVALIICVKIAKSNLMLRPMTRASASVPLSTLSYPSSRRMTMHRCFATKLSDESIAASINKLSNSGSPFLWKKVR
jgi:hypothetical protein